MFASPPPFVDGLLALPLPLLAAVVMVFWALLTWTVHCAVPRLCGRDGARLGRFEPEVAAQLGLVFGLLLSFNAVTVWEQSTAARDAVLAEASGLREVAELLPDLRPEQQPAAFENLTMYLRHLIETEWHQLQTGDVRLDKPAALQALAAVARTSGNEDLHHAVADAAKARQDRIRIATRRMLPARWTVVIILAALTIVAVGFVHAEHTRARAIALGMVAFGIASCFIVLFAHMRPFLGTLALQPTELYELLVELVTP